ARNQRRRRHDLVPLGLEVLEERPSDLVDASHSLILKARGRALCERTQAPLARVAPLRQRNVDPDPAGIGGAKVRPRDIRSGSLSHFAAFSGPAGGLSRNASGAALRCPPRTAPNRT